MNGIIDKCVAAGFERTLVTRWFTPGPRVFFGITSYGDLYTTFPQEKDTTPQAVLNHLKTLMNNVPTEIVRGLCLHPKNMAEQTLGRLLQHAATITAEENRLFTYVEKEKFAVGEECFPSAVMCVDASGRTKGLRISEAVQYEDAGAVFGDVLVGMRFDVYPEAVKFGC